MKFGSISFKTSSENKIYFPDDGITKGEILNYYKSIAPVMIPQIKERPISMLRYPEGIGGENFFQKDAPGHFPKWIKRVRIKKEGGTVNHVLCNNAAALVYIANQGTLTPHVWLSKADKIYYPDRLIFDLDPSDEDFGKVKKTAEYFLDFLEKELSLQVFIMTTGSRGIHLVIPLYRNKIFDEVRRFARDSANYMTNKYPELITAEVRKEKRGNKVFIDTARNGYAQTSVAPYAVRAKKGAPVAAPISRTELFESGLSAQSFNIKNIFQKLEQKGDPWVNINLRKNSLMKRQNLPDFLKKNERK